jgi:hypothetical protein
MKRYQGGNEVKGGFYFNTSQKDLVTLENDFGMLPGNETDTYIRVPLPVMLAAGPIIGLIYVIFLPFVAFAMVLSVGATKAWAGARWFGNWMLQAATANWKPGVAYLAWWRHSEKRKEQKIEAKTPAAETAVTRDALSKMEKEIADRRKEEHEEKAK